MSPPLPAPLTEEHLDREFMAQVEPDWEKLLTCMQCGTCSASCPTADLMDYSPRQLWELVRLGLRDVVMNSRTFWLCTQCYACSARCPRDSDQHHDAAPAGVGRRQWLHYPPNAPDDAPGRPGHTQHPQRG